MWNIPIGYQLYRYCKTVTKNLVRGENRSDRTNFGDQKWSGRTEYDAKICPVNPKLVRAHKYLVHAEISLILCENGLSSSSGEGDAKNGNLVEETI